MIHRPAHLVPVCAIVAASTLIAQPLRAGVILNFDGNASGVMARSALGSGPGAPNDTEQISILSLPFSTPADAELSGWTTTATHDLTEARFQFAFQQQTGMGSAAYTNGQGAIFFEVTEDTPYAIGGAYSVTLHDGEPASTVTNVFLTDQDAGGAAIFIDRDPDVGASPQAGSATGILQANRAYLLSYHFELWHPLESSGSSSATGGFALVLPEPAGLACAAMLAVLVACSRRARQRL